MATDDRRVVVTGLGLVTPVGLDVESTWQGLLEGRSGAGPITRFDASEHDVRIACEVDDFDPHDYMDRKQVKRTDRFVQFALATADEAVEQAGVEEAIRSLPGPRAGVVVGSGIGGLQTLEEQHRRLVERGPGRVSPFFIPMFIADMASGQVSMRYDARGPNYATVSACASSGHALGLAYRSIRTSEADVMIAGGAEATVTPLCVAGFSSMKALSTRNDEPDRASRPFDVDRDGFVLGEGAGMMILESLEHARERGAPIVAELLGFGQTADAHHITAPPPEGEGAQAAMRLALEDAEVEPEDVAYVNAHGTSTPTNDATESTAIRRVFGDHTDELIVGSTKSMTGHTLGAAGALEGAVTALVCQRGRIPPTINLETEDPECGLNYAAGSPLEREVRVGITNSFGFGGHNVCLAFGRWEDGA